MGFDETPSRLIATAVSELARNILKYAGTGEIRLRQVEGRSGRGIEIEAVDRGPGIEDLEAAMRDHFSSGGTLGLGLPGVRRMMDEFSLESTPGEGTRVTAVKWM
jgi:serine/threonine-protein kinase RsbT